MLFLSLSLLFVHITRYAFFFVLLLVFYCSFSSSSSSPWCFRIAPHCFSHSKCLSIVWCFTKAGKSSRYFYCFKCFRQYWNGRIYQLKNLALSLLISFEIAWKRTEHKHIGSSHTKQRHEQRAKRAKASRKKKKKKRKKKINKLLFCLRLIQCFYYIVWNFTDCDTTRRWFFHRYFSSRPISIKTRGTGNEWRSKKNASYVCFRIVMSMACLSFIANTFSRFFVAGHPDGL